MKHDSMLRFEKNGQCNIILVLIEYFKKTQKENARQDLKEKIRQTKKILFTFKTKTNVRFLM